MLIFLKQPVFIDQSFYSVMSALGVEDEIEVYRLILDHSVRLSRAGAGFGQKKFSSTAEN